MCTYYPYVQLHDATGAKATHIILVWSFNFIFWIKKKNLFKKRIYFIKEILNTLRKSSIILGHFNPPVYFLIQLF